MEVNGFNELIVTYGWDDDNIYDRPQACAASGSRSRPSRTCLMTTLHGLS